MKWPVVVGFLVVCLARYNEGGALKCTPGSEDASCITKKEEEVSSQTYPAPVKSELKSGKKCLPGSSWKSQCNQCTCSDDGYPSCTEIGCGDNASGSQLRCEPSTAWKDECNACWCTPEGQATCTRMECVNFENEPVKKLVEDIQSNVSLSRKVRALPSAQEPPKVCKPGQEFRMDCNKCLCDNEGQDFSCTRIDCIALNSNNNGGSRRKREISEKVPLKCVPGSVFDRDCNVCRCTQDGQYATCTIKRCQQTEKKDEDHATGRYGSGVRIPLQRWRAI